MKRLTSIVAGITLPFISGCAFLFSPPFVSGTPPNPKLDPILPPSTTQEITQRGKIVANSLEKHFPKGLVIYLEEEDKYAHLDVSKKKFKSLRVTAYKIETPLEQELEKYFIREQTKTQIFYHPDLAKILDANYEFRAILNDSGIDGLKDSDPEDYLKTNSKLGEEELRQGKRISNGRIEEDKLNELLKKANILYLNYLKKLTSE